MGLVLVHVELDCPRSQAWQSWKSN